MATTTSPLGPMVATICDMQFLHFMISPRVSYHFVRFRASSWGGTPVGSFPGPNRESLKTLREIMKSWGPGIRHRTDGTASPRWPRQQPGNLTKSLKTLREIMKSWTPARRIVATKGPKGDVDVANSKIIENP